MTDAQGNSQLPPLHLTLLERSAASVLRLFCHARNLKHEDETNTAPTNLELDRSNLERLSRLAGERWQLAGRRVLEVGCGTGDLALCMAQAGADVVGIDLDEARVRHAMAKCRAHGQEDKARFLAVNVHEYQPERLFDLIVSVDAFEHVHQPAAMLKKLASLLSPGGRLVCVFGPLWYSAQGAHLFGFVRIPWAHLLFPEKSVLAVRREVYRPSDPATRYEDIRGGLNRLTVSKFSEMLSVSGLEFDSFDINPLDSRSLKSRVQRLLVRIPFISPLFQHTVFCILRKRSA